MAINGDQLPEAQWFSPLAQTLPGFVVPEVAKLTVGLGETAGQGRIKNDRQLRPVDGQPLLRRLFALARLGRQQRLAVEDVFDFVEQLLGATGTECRNQDGAMVSQRLIDRLFEALLAVGTVFMQAVAVGAFQHQDVGSLRRFWGLQQWRMGRPEVSRKNYAFVGSGFQVVDIAFNVRRTQHMARTLKADIADQVRGIDELMPLIVGHGDDGLLYTLEVAIYCVLVTGDAELEGIFQH